jgi:hypothetical protein
MKIHNDFTLYFRVVPSGKRVVYFYAYDENGKRMAGKSTGEITMTAARRICNRLFKERGRWRRKRTPCQHLANMRRAGGSGRAARI